jgi:aminoglycoside phosphotransferase family enzyme
MRMLDRLIARGEATTEVIRCVVGRLARFYRDSAPVASTAPAYRAAFVAGNAENRRELRAPAYELPAALVDGVCARLDALLRSRPELFDERVRAGRIVEAHGDLRPEHVCVETEPQIIDCLEFARALRTLDAADELAFLALECERLGAPELAAPIFATYGEVTGDAPPATLLAFYRSYRACVRAKLALRHLDDVAPREPSKWAAQALAYLRLADAHAARMA